LIRIENDRNKNILVMLRHEASHFMRSIMNKQQILRSSGLTKEELGKNRK
jgi:hypothetical protein